MKLQAIRVVFDIRNTLCQLCGFLQIVLVAKIYRDDLLECFLSPRLLEYSTTYVKLYAFAVVFDVRSTVYIDLGRFLQIVIDICCEDVS